MLSRAAKRRQNGLGAMSPEPTVEKVAVEKYSASGNAFIAPTVMNETAHTQTSMVWRKKIPRTVVTIATILPKSCRCRRNQRMISGIDRESSINPNVWTSTVAATRTLPKARLINMAGAKFLSLHECLRQILYRG